MAPVSSRIAAALRGGRLAKVPVAPLPILQKAELGRQHWERVLRLVNSEPHDYDLHLEKAYDSLVAFCEALIAAHGYRRKSSSHAFLLELGVELLDAVRRLSWMRSGNISAKSGTRRSTTVTGWSTSGSGIRPWRA